MSHDFIVIVYIKWLCPGLDSIFGLGGSCNYMPGAVEISGRDSLSVHPKDEDHSLLIILWKL